MSFGVNIFGEYWDEANKTWMPFEGSGGIFYSASDSIFHLVGYHSTSYFEPIPKWSDGLPGQFSILPEDLSMNSSWLRMCADSDSQVKISSAESWVNFDYDQVFGEFILRFPLELYESSKEESFRSTTEFETALHGIGNRYYHHFYERKGPEYFDYRLTVTFREFLEMTAEADLWQQLLDEIKPFLDRKARILCARG